MGGAGAGLGTALAYWAVLVVIILVMLKNKLIASYQLWQWSPVQYLLLKAGLKLGLPIGLQVFAEVAIFAVVSLQMAKFSLRSLLLTSLQ